MVLLGITANNYVRLLAPIFGLLVLSLAARGQKPSPESSAAYLKGDSLRIAARYDSSNTYFQRAIDGFEESNAWHNKAMALYKISLNKSAQDELKLSEQYLDEALALHQQNDADDLLFKVKVWHQRGVLDEANAHYDEALKWYQRALKTARRLEGSPSVAIRLLTSIGDVYQSQGRYEKALQKLGEAESFYRRHQVKEERLLGRIFNSYGIAHQGQGHWQTALQYYRKSLQVDQKILPDPHPDLAKSYNNMAITYYYQSDYQRALEHMKNSTRIFVEFYGKNHRLVAAGYNNIGIVYSEVGELGKATDYLERALKIKKNLLGMGHPDIAIGYQNLGAIYYDMDQYDRAISYYKRAMSLYLEHFPEGHPELANTYANLGQSYAHKQAYGKALGYYQKDLEINLERLGPAHPFIGDTYTKIGVTYGMEGNYQQALQYFRQAVDIFIKGPNKEVATLNFPVEEVLYPTQLVETLQQKANVLQEYAQQSGTLSPLRRAMQTYMQLAQLIEDLQQSYRREGSKLQLRKRTADLYNEGFAAAYELLGETGNPDYKEYAFYFAEKSTGQILLEQLQHIKARKFAGVPDSLINREYRIRERLTTLQHQLTAQAESSQQDDSLRHLALEDSLFHTRQALTRHIKQVEQTYPAFYELKYEPVVVRASEVRADMLSEKETMIRYFWGTDALYAFVLTKQETVLRKLTVDSLLQQDIVNYRDQMRDVESVETFSQQSYSLFARLLEPLLDQVKGTHLTIIPDGALHHLPFESLLRHSPTNQSWERFHQLPYLVKDYTISYAPSASYLEVSHQIRTPENQKPFLGFAPVFDHKRNSTEQRSYPNSDRPLSPLLLSKHEVETLGTLFENSQSSHRSTLKPVLYLEDDATEAVFKKMSLADYRYIHLATHAFVSEQDPRQSAILFETTTAEEDGILYASEIYNLQLNAELVTLSACKTGIGSLSRGEGIMSLSRAFQYAGAENLLVSLWEVNDRSTARLMERFYRGHMQDVPMPEALQQAKNEMINSIRYGHPKYWAPFVFVGH